MDGLFPPISLTAPRRLTDVPSWQEHIPFAFWLIDRLRPRTFVELGVHAGDSYCAFCQAVQHVGAATRCFGVDSWCGDGHAIDYDGAAVLAELRQHHDPLYAHFSTLLPMTFDEARDGFADGSIDLLHIDGYHTYEAVRHDFETYQAKLSPRALVLFHDTQVRVPVTFGAWRFWEELRGQFRHFEFEHGHGLGVLAAGTEAAAQLPELFAANEAGIQAARGCFCQMGAWLREVSRLRFDVRRLDGEVNWLRQERARLLSDVERAEHRQAYLADEIESMQQSLSWKLGTALTSPARVLRRAPARRARADT